MTQARAHTHTYTNAHTNKLLTIVSLVVVGRFVGGIVHQFSVLGVPQAEALLHMKTHTPGGHVALGIALVQGVEVLEFESGFAPNFERSGVKRVHARAR